MIQIDLGVSEQPEDLKFEKVMNLFNKHVLSSKDLMVNKNHDYGEAWRDMRVSSLTGVGAQGGSLKDVVENCMNNDLSILWMQLILL